MNHNQFVNLEKNSKNLEKYQLILDDQFNKIYEQQEFINADINVHKLISQWCAFLCSVKYIAVSSLRIINSININNFNNINVDNVGNVGNVSNIGNVDHVDNIDINDIDTIDNIMPNKNLNDFKNLAIRMMNSLEKIKKNIELFKTYIDVKYINLECVSSLNLEDTMQDFLVFTLVISNFINSIDSYFAKNIVVCSTDHNGYTNINVNHVNDVSNIIYDNSININNIVGNTFENRINNTNTITNSYYNFMKKNWKCLLCNVIMLSCFAIIIFMFFLL